ncbi:MAG: phenylalanine--tRNA ligase subunit alpha [Clostridia bacterium]|jgi:phenylalanyl-tRNA synthetase alpha chain|nr:phenylalanine--tRNA ligase subunit alpha [Clostridia bacterium]
MKGLLEEIRVEVTGLLDSAASMTDLETIKVKYLGKKGKLTDVLKGMKDLTAEERPEMGKLANEVRDYIEEKLVEYKRVVREKEIAGQIESEKIDVTVPGNREKVGSLHPLTIVTKEIEEFFMGLGYSIEEGPEIEKDYYNFEALNIPENHPAKDEQDTFYISKDVVLRTQTSPVQVRTMEKGELPIKIIAPGRVFRSDEVDATHSPVFHQLEGLVVDKGITMSDLKGTLSVFAKKMFGEKTVIKFRPSFFPFTEPSSEVDVSCFKCSGKDSNCKVCKGSGWIEVLGCGMVHPRVLEKAGIDPNVYSGFAFGMGIERIAMLRYGIDDLRLFYENDDRFLKQFK